MLIDMLSIDSLVNIFINHLIFQGIWLFSVLYMCCSFPKSFNIFQFDLVPTIALGRVHIADAGFGNLARLQSTNRRIRVAINGIEIPGGAST